STTQTAVASWATRRRTRDGDLSARQRRTPHLVPLDHHNRIHLRCAGDADRLPVVHLLHRHGSSRWGLPECLDTAALARSADPATTQEMAQTRTGTHPRARNERSGRVILFVVTAGWEPFVDLLAVGTHRRAGFCRLGHRKHVATQCDHL